MTALWSRRPEDAHRADAGEANRTVEMAFAGVEPAGRGEIDGSPVRLGLPWRTVVVALLRTFVRLLM